MKKVIFISLLAFFALSLNTAFAQNDSIYVMRNGSVIWKYKFSDIDSIIYYNPDNINTYDKLAKIEKIVVEDNKGSKEFNGNTVTGDWVLKIRQKSINKIKIYFIKEEL